MQKLKQNNLLPLAPLFVFSLFAIVMYICNVSKANLELKQQEIQPSVEIETYDESELKPIEEPAESKTNQGSEPDMKTYVLGEVEKAGLNPKEAECIIEKESKWDTWANNWNFNGTTDSGLWQINSIHKKTISVQDRFDYKKATEWAINKRLKEGNWNAWYGWRKCK